MDAHESPRKRLESTLPKDYEDHIVGKGYNSISDFNLVHKFLPMPQAMKISDAKATVHKEWKKFETMPTSLASGRDEEQNGWYSGSTKSDEKYHFATYEILIGFRLYRLCMNKKMFETTNNRTIPE